jgi:hypothetical protein
MSAESQPGPVTSNHSRLAENGTLRHNIRQALPPIYEAMSHIRESIGAPNLLEEARKRNEHLLSVVEQLAELLEYRRLGDLDHLRKMVQAGIQSSMTNEEVVRTVQDRQNGTHTVPTAHARPAIKPGRKPNRALEEYLRAGNYLREADKTIAKKFRVSKNTVRRYMARLELFRPTDEFRTAPVQAPVQVREEPVRG